MTSKRKLKVPVKFTDGEIGVELTAIDRNAQFVTVKFVDDGKKKEVAFIGDIQLDDDQPVHDLKLLKKGQPVKAKYEGNVFWQATVIKTVNGACESSAKEKMNNKDVVKPTKAKQKQSSKKKEKDPASTKKKKELQEEEKKTTLARQVAAQELASQLFLDKHANNSPNQPACKTVSGCPEVNLTCPLQSRTNPTSQLVEPVTAQTINATNSQTVATPTGQTITALTSQTITAPSTQTATTPTCRTITAQTGQTVTARTGKTATAQTGKTVTVQIGQTVNGQTVTAQTGQTITGQIVTAQTGQTFTAPTGQTVMAPNGQTLTAQTDQTFTAPTGQTLTAPTGQTLTSQTDQTFTAQTCQTFTAPSGQTVTGQNVTDPTGQSGNAFSFYNCDPSQPLNPRPLTPQGYFPYYNNYLQSPPMPRMPPAYNSYFNHGMHSPFLHPQPYLTSLTACPADQSMTACNSVSPDLQPNFISSSVEILDNEDSFIDLDNSLESNSNNDPENTENPVWCNNSTNTCSPCKGCADKDQEIAELKRKLACLEDDGAVSIVTRKRMYAPKTRPEVKLADYVLVPKNSAAPAGFKILAPGATVAVRPMWITEMLATVNRQRTKKQKRAERESRQVREDQATEILKKLIDGFF